MDRKKWLSIQIILEFIFIYIASSLSIFLIILSFLFSKYYDGFPSPSLLTSGISLFMIVAIVFADILENFEELIILKIKECEKNDANGG